MAKLGMMIVAWVGKQLPVVSGTGVITGEGLFKGLTMGVVLLVAVGVGLLSCVCCIRSAPANWKCTRDKRTRGCRAAKLHDFERTEIINHVKERTWSLSWYAGDQLVQLMVMLNARCCQDTLVQFLRRIAIMSENQTMCGGDNRVWGEFFRLGYMWR